MAYALVTNGLVASVSSEFSMGGIPCGDAVQVGWLYSNNSFTPNPALAFTAKNWYWAVAGSTTQVWSSSAVAYVPTTDATYQAWKNQGNTPIAIASDALLASYFAANYPPGWPPTAAQIAQAAAASALASGLQISSVSHPEINSTYALTDNAQTYINGIMSCILSTGGFFSGSSTQLYFDIAGNAKIFTNTTVFKDFALAVGNYVNAVTQYALSGGTQGSLPSNQVAIP